MHFYILEEFVDGKDAQEQAANRKRSLDMFIGDVTPIPDEEQHPVIKTPSWWRPGMDVDDVDALVTQLRQRGR